MAATSGWKVALLALGIGSALGMGGVGLFVLSQGRGVVSDDDARHWQERTQRAVEQMRRDDGLVAAPGAVSTVAATAAVQVRIGRAPRASGGPPRRGPGSRR